MISDAKRAELDAISAVRAGLIVADIEQISGSQRHLLDDRRFDHEVERRLAQIENTVERIEKIVERLSHPTKNYATRISFKEITMLSTTGGNTLIYTGTLSPVGSVLAPDFVATATSNDPAVLPTVDATGLIVTVPLPSGWVENASLPLSIAYATTSASTSQALAATITPSAPVTGNLATAIDFAQTT